MLFNSKKDISPLLEGFTDIHCHVLPGIDDGAKTIEESLAMLKAYQKVGIYQLIATPHVLEGSYPNTPTTINQAFHSVKKLLQKKTDIKSQVVHASAEYMLDENFNALLNKKELIPLAKKYILIEMSYFQKPINLNETIFNIQHKGFTPVLAHPERYNFIKKESEYMQLLRMGCKFQLNLLSLSNHYGSETQQKAFSLLKSKMYTFAGTDAHHVNHIEKLMSIKVSKKLIYPLNAIIQETTQNFSK